MKQTKEGKRVLVCDMCLDEGQKTVQAVRVHPILTMLDKSNIKGKMFPVVGSIRDLQQDLCPSHLAKVNQLVRTNLVNLGFKLVEDGN